MHLGINTGYVKSIIAGNALIELEKKNVIIPVPKHYREIITKSFKEHILIDVFVQYEGLQLAIPKDTKNGEYMCINDGLKYIEHIDYDGSLFFKCMDKIHPFKRTKEWVDLNYKPKGEILITDI